MAAPHNIFSDTELGGKLTFRQLPADGTTAITLLGLSTPVSGLSDLFKFTPASVQTLLGISGTANQFALFGASNAIGSTPLLVKNGTNLDFSGHINLTTNTNLFATTLAAAGSTPANLKLACFDGTQLKAVGPPGTIVAGHVYYFQISSTGYGWNEQVPGGGPATGVTGSGTPGTAAKWNNATDLTFSALSFTTSGASLAGNLEINPGERAWAVELLAGTTRQWYSDVRYTPAFTVPINAGSAVLVNESNYLRAADQPRLRAWMELYSRSEVDSLLNLYLPLTAGFGKPITGDLLISKSSPTVTLTDTTGQVMAMRNFNGTWVVLQSDRGLGGSQNGLEYFSSSGDFMVWQKPAGTWVQNTVATQQWSVTRFDPLNGPVSTNRITLAGTNVLVGGGPGSASEITLQSPLSIVGTQLQTSAKVASVWLTAPSYFSVTSGTSAAPVTTTGSLTFAWVSVTANTFLAGPADAGDKPADTPAFRPLVLADIPNGALGTGTATTGTALFGGATPSARSWKSAVTDAVDSDRYARRAGSWVNLEPTFSGIDSSLSIRPTGSGTIGDLAKFTDTRVIGSINKSDTKTWLAITSTEVSHSGGTIGTAVDAKLPKTGGTVTGALFFTGLGSEVSGSGSYRFLVHDPVDNQMKPMSAAYARGHIDAAAAVHYHSGLDITTGAVAPAHLGSGTADSTTFLRGDGSWQPVPGGGISEPPGVGTWVRVVTVAGQPGVWMELVGSTATGVTVT